MFEEQGLCSDGARATGSKEFRESDNQVNDEDEQFAHGAKATTIGLAGKTARKARYDRQFINSPSTGNIPNFVSPVPEARSGSTFVDTVSPILRRIGFETCVYSNGHAREHSCLLVASHYTHR